MVGNNTPVFFIRDPQKFQDFIHSQKRRADTNLRDNNMQWDFWTLSPESAHQVTWLMGDRGIPKTWRHMNGYCQPHLPVGSTPAARSSGSSTTSRPTRASTTSPRRRPTRLAGEDPDSHHPRPLRPRSRAATHPSWTLKVQIMPFEDAADYRFNPFDLTKVWPHSDYPLITVGRMVLDRNPDNYFAADRAGRVRAVQPGARASAQSRTRCCSGRLFSYPDTHRHRIGPNYLQLPVNQPKVAGAQLQPGRRDALPTTRGDPVYAPNSLRRPGGRPDASSDPAWQRRAGEIVRTGLHAAPRGRRLRPARHDGTARCSTTRHGTGWSTNIAGHLKQGRRGAGARPRRSTTGARSTTTSAPRWPRPSATATDRRLGPPPS